MTVSDVIVSPAPLATFFARCASGCFWSSWATGVGREKESVALVTRSNVGSAKARPSSVIPELGQVTEDDSKSEWNESCDVFQEDECGS